MPDGALLACVEFEFSFITQYTIVHMLGNLGFASSAFAAAVFRDEKSDDSLAIVDCAP